MGKYFWGILLILLGIGFLLDQTNVIEFGEMISAYWPSIIILVGISNLFKKDSSKFGNFIVIIVGVLLQINKLGYLDYNVFSLFWPIILIIIGLNIIISKGGRKHKNPINFNKSSEKFDRNITSEDTIDSFVVFAGLETNNQSQEFKGGNITALFGGVELNLREAKLHNNEGYMEINSIFGGVEIYVPSNWRVEMSGTPIFGGWSNKTRPNPDINAPVVKIKCFVMFGGIDIN